MTHRARSPPVVPRIPLQKVRSPCMSPRSLSSPTSSTWQTSSPTNSKSNLRSGLCGSRVDDGSLEMKVSPRFGFESTSSLAHHARQSGATRATSKSDRQAKALAAHIARQKENRSEVSVRKNPLLGSPRIGKKISAPASMHHPNNASVTRRKPVHHLSLDSANFSSIFEDETTTSDVGTDFDTYSLAESTSGKITTLCEKADVLMRELVEMVGPITPPITPTGNIMPQGSEQKENQVCKEEKASNQRVIRQSSEPSHHHLSTLDPSLPESMRYSKEGREDVTDLQFRISRLELQVSQINHAKSKQTAVAEDIAELKRWLEISQVELLSTREEARDTKIQLDLLTKRASMLETRSASYPGLENSSCLDNSEFSALPTEIGCDVHQFTSVSSDGSQVLHGIPPAFQRSQARLPRARSMDSVTRHRFYPVTRPNNTRFQQVSQQPIAKEVVPPRRRSFPSPPPAAETSGKGMLHNTTRLQKTEGTKIAVCNTKPWRSHPSARPALLRIGLGRNVRACGDNCD